MMGMIDDATSVGIFAGNHKIYLGLGRHYGIKFKF